MAAAKYLFTRKASNKKLGPIPVVTSQSTTCPKSCPMFKDNTCFGKAGPISWIWKSLDKGKPMAGKNPLKAYTLNQLCKEIKKIPENMLWRYGQVGDLPGKNLSINWDQFHKVIAANIGKRGFAYTHKPVEGKSELAYQNKAIIKTANNNGFTVNLSANNLKHADRLAELEIAPVVAVVESTRFKNTKTPSGRKVKICPASLPGSLQTCATCRLCADSKRNYIIGFPAHGAGKTKINNQLTKD